MTRAEKAAARRVQCMLDIKFQDALFLVREAKTDQISWSEAADLLQPASASGDDAWQAAE